MQAVPVIQKPTGRGRFCHRDVWDLIHQDRFHCWLEGAAIDAIAQVHRVTSRSIHSSVAKVMAGLHRNDRNQALQYRYESRYGWKIHDLALTELHALMNAPAIFAEFRRM